MNHAGVGVEAPLLRVEGLRKVYHRGGQWRSTRVFALDDVSLRVDARSRTAIVGDSGAGKSTLARCIARLARPDSGSIWIDGVDWSAASERVLRPLRSKAQLIFQDPSTALNPRFTAEELIAEPLRIQRIGTARSQRERARELMSEVGLSPDWSRRRPSEFSGGQQQRLAIARALALRPQLLILDEALTGLDLSTEAHIVKLLLDLQQSHGLTYLLISHDLPLVSHFAQDVAVMSAGRIVERGPVADVLRRPAHPATQALVAAAQSLQEGFPRLGASA